MESLRNLSDVQELDYALALEDQKALDEAWGVLAAGMENNGETPWTIEYEKRQVYRQREISDKWHKMLYLARIQEVTVPVPEWVES